MRKGKESAQSLSGADAPYWDIAHTQIGRVLSLLDAEQSSPSRGSFDRTWWCWKFTDFSAPRFQEGAHVLAWLLTSPLAPAETRGNARLIDLASASFRFWGRLQHHDGSFDEAYPYERSLAATAFTLFYLGSAAQRLAQILPADDLAGFRRTAERAAGWLARNYERHGILSNHLAAAAAALQVAGDIFGTDRWQAARDRFLGTIFAQQDQTEGWMREYSGADPGYQSHGLFYLADIHRRSGGDELLDRIDRAMTFGLWFAHPDGSMGGEYASRGTKFAFPAAFEMLAPRLTSAAATAAHLRETIAAGRGVGPLQMDAWNLFPMLNNYLFAAEAATSLASQTPPLPWQGVGCKAVFKNAGLAVANFRGRLMACSPGSGGALKLWCADTGRLIYEDCGYGLPLAGGGWAVSQSTGQWAATEDEDGRLAIEIESSFVGTPSIRFNPTKFLAFRLFNMSVGRLPSMARLLKDILVKVLIHRRPPNSAKLFRRITFCLDGDLRIEDRLANLSGEPHPLGRNVPIHMGSARYVDIIDALGPMHDCPRVEMDGAASGHRVFHLPSQTPPPGSP